MKNPLSLIFLAGGIGSRFGANLPKQFTELAGIPVVLHSLRTLTALENLVEIVVVCDPLYRHYFEEYSGKIRFANPGKERFDSVKNGLTALSSIETLVLIHDGARPLVNSIDIERLTAKAAETGAATLGNFASSTIKEVDLESGTIQRTLSRKLLFEAHTPQCILKSLFREAYAAMVFKEDIPTDDVSLIEILGKNVAYVEASSPNIKITTPKDLHVAAALLQL